MKTIAEYDFLPTETTTIMMHAPATCFGVVTVGEFIPGQKIAVLAAQETDNQLDEVEIRCYRPFDEVDVAPGMKWLGRVVCDGQPYHVFQCRAPDVSRKPMPVPKEVMEKIAEQQRAQEQPSADADGASEETQD